MDRVDAQKAFRKSSAMIEINLDFEWLAGVRGFESIGAVDRLPGFSD
jgi:hypothetical protein